MKQESSLKFAGKLQDYKLLIKFNLSFMVVFSALISYLLAPKVKEYDWVEIGLFFIGGMLVTGSANTINQIVEKDTDALMKRTANRPVASGRMSTQEAWTFALLAGVGGVLILWHFNFLTAALQPVRICICLYPAEEGKFGCCAGGSHSGKPALSDRLGSG
jgi:heme o synthase